jgi:hypothetical protein
VNAGPWMEPIGRGPLLHAVCVAMPCCQRHGLTSRSRRI